MRTLLLVAALCLAFLAGPARGAIVYSGSQNVTLSLSPMQLEDSATISVAGDPEYWDDFQVDLWEELSMTPPGGMSMGLGTRLAIHPASTGMSPGMTLTPRQIIGTGNLVANLDTGDVIGPGSPVTDDQPGRLTPGEFDADGGFIGLVTGEGQYAWLHMLSQENIGAFNHSVTFDGWAYETEPGQPLTIGDTGAVPVPGALCLGLLGAGVLGLARTTRKQRT